MAKTKSKRKADDLVDGTAGQVLESGEGGVESGQNAPQTPAVTDPAAAPPDDAPPEPAATQPAARVVSIDVPVAPIDPDAYLSDHIEGRLTPAQKRGLRGVLNGADASHARLASGRVVQTSIDAVRLVLEAIDQATGGGE